MAAKIKKITKLEKVPEERQIITAMIVDPAFLRQLRPIIKPEYFKAPFARTVSGWCLEHWDQYQEAPGKHIEAAYKTAERKGVLDEDVSALIETFLESLSEEYEHSDNRSTEYYAKNAERYFRLREAEMLQDDLTRLQAAGDVQALEQRISEFKRPARDEGGWVDPFTNEEAIREAFTRASDPLFKLPGALGEMLNGLFIRQGFLAFMGPEKRGKTFWLMHLSRMAARAKLNTAFFAVGDMSREQMVIRYGIMQTKRSNRQKYCGEILVPVLDCWHNQTGGCDLDDYPGLGDSIVYEADGGKKKVLPFSEVPDHEPCDHCRKDAELKHRYRGATWWEVREPVEPLTWRQALRAGKEFAERLSGKSRRLSCHPNTSINVREIDALLNTWRNLDGFVPDVIFIDYADILAPEDSKKSERGQENDRWKAMRKLSQDWNCLLVTATQADAASYEADVIRENNFSEDKRKYSHVTGIITLNQSEKWEEKSKGVMRIGTMFLREDQYEASETVTVHQCLAMGQPALGSYPTPKKKKEK